MKTVGAYEAKTHLARLLDEAAGGETIAITKHGVTVALLVPPGRRPQQDVDALIDRWRRIRKGITLGPDLTIRELIEEGRD